MRILTLLLLIISTSLQAQWKSVDGTINDTPVENLEISKPDFYPNFGHATHTNAIDYGTISLKNYHSNSFLSSIFLEKDSDAIVRNLPEEEMNIYVYEQLISEKILPTNISLQEIGSEEDELGIQHIRYQVTYEDIPIRGAEIIAHIGDRNTIYNGKVANSYDIDTEPSLAIHSIKNIVDGDFEQKYTDHNLLNLFTEAKDTYTLVIDEGRLVYIAEVYENLAHRWSYTIDAHSGEILDKHLAMCTFHNVHGVTSEHHETSHIHNHECSTASEDKLLDGPKISNARDLYGKNVNINTYNIGSKYYMIDATRTMYDNGNSSLPNEPVGAVWTIDAFNTSPENNNFNYDHVITTQQNFTNRREAVSAHINGGSAYEYFRNVHARESINGSGGNIISLVNVSDANGNSMGNAFWNGVGIFYGNGDASFVSLAKALDVAGHEMTHGVIQTTANLQYKNESGAINESMADVFGTLIEREDWLMGEDVVKTSSFPSGALRNMADPHNGAQTGDYGRGWQPAHYSERYTGTQDNGGVHINSGIPNRAFYLFASNDNVGLDKAEKVYYRALTKYLVSTSNFADLRKAVEQSANDLYGDQVKNVASQAFQTVGITGSGTTNVSDSEVNPGEDLIVFTTESQQNVYIAKASDGTIVINNPLSEKTLRSVPSVTDNGEIIVFVDNEKKISLVVINWENQTAQEGYISEEQIWRNVVVSKDGKRLAAVTDQLEPAIFVYDFTTEQGKTFPLVNPTYTEGISTGDVLYADAMEFDLSGEILMYDAKNKIASTFSQSGIEYWDINFMEVYNNSSNSFAPDKQVQKLFTSLENDESVGNPTFSKNSPSIIAFDYLKGQELNILGADTRTGKIGTIANNLSEIGYPKYSIDDDRIIFNAESSSTKVIAFKQLNDDKISSNDQARLQLGYQGNGIKWGNWFGNGERVLTDVEEEINENIDIYPIPATDYINIKSIAENDMSYEISSIDGTSIKKGSLAKSSKTRISINDMISGAYIVTIKSDKGQLSKIFIKQ